MNETLEFVSVSSLLLVGSFFVLTGALGVWRMPNFFTRLHPAGIADSLGFPCVLFALIVVNGLNLVSAKLLLLLIFIMLTGPVACHALAKAAYLQDKKSPFSPPPKQQEP